LPRQLFTELLRICYGEATRGNVPNGFCIGYTQQVRCSWLRHAATVLFFALCGLRRGYPSPLG